jgi:hypothetical protein
LISEILNLNDDEINNFECLTFNFSMISLNKNL